MNVAHFAAHALRALESALRQAPKHTLALHLYIHLTEASMHAALATPAADTLVSEHLEAGHLIHMAAHNYLRVGRYGFLEAKWRYFESFI